MQIDRKTKESIKRGGCIIDPPKLEDAVYNHVFEIGATEDTFSWSPFLPPEEKQFATQSCVSFSRLNCAETKNKKEGGDPLDLSDLDLTVISGTTMKGNNLNNPSEAFRKIGVVKESDRPWKQEWLNKPKKYRNDIVNSPVASDARRYKGGNHSWVYGKSAMRQALNSDKGSPLQIAIGVGDNWGGGIIKDPKDYFSYHAVELYWIDGAGNYFIYDTYPPFNKTLDTDYNILRCKSFQDLPSNWKEVRDQYIESIRQVFGSTWKPADIFYRRHLIDKGIYGAVRVGGSSVIPPYRVFTIGPSGKPIESQDEFKQLFGTIFQNSIVGVVSPEQAQLLGITTEQFKNSVAIELKSSLWVALWRNLTY